MRVRISPSPNPLPQDLGGPAAIPGSKSHTQRALVLAAFLPGERRIQNALRSRDTEVLCAALEKLGARVRFTDTSAFVRGREGFAPDAEVDLEENASALRMLLAIVPLLGGRLSVRGADGLRARPLAPSLDLLAQAGVTPSAPTLPCVVDARRAVWPATIVVDASLTTQVASGALLGVALRSYWGGGDLTVAIRGASAPEYVALTLATLEAAGFEVLKTKSRDTLEVRIALGTRSTLRGFKIPPDASSLCFVRALAALHDLPPPAWLHKLRSSGHPDDGIAEDLAALLRAPVGGTVVLDDLGSRPDAVPALAVVAATRRVTTRITRIGALRHKESDRIAALVKALRALGVDASDEPDALRIRGPLPAKPAAKPKRLPVPADHRIVMAIALLGTLVGEGIELESGEAVAKSWPGYWDWLAALALVER